MTRFDGPDTQEEAMSSETVTVPRTFVERVAWAHDWHTGFLVHGPHEAEWLNADEGWVECDCFERANELVTA